MASPNTALGALYDSFLQAALRRFFERATLDAEPTPGAPADARLAIEPSADPYALSIRWFGTRYTLHVPRRWAFTPHEVRLARAIGVVLAARYRVGSDPQLMAERSDLFRGAIEDRYVGAFLDPVPYIADDGAGLGDRVFNAIELLRVAALSSYENRPISTGVLLLGETSSERFVPEARAIPSYGQGLTAVKSFYRLADGLRTVFLAASDGRLLDIIDLEDWAHDYVGARPPDVPCAKSFQAHALATLVPGSVCAVLSPSREIKVFAEGAQVFGFRSANWHLFDLQAKFELWAEAVGDRRLAERLFQTALDLADAREGAIFAVLREPARAVQELVAPADRLDTIDLPMAPGLEPFVPSRRDLLRLLRGRSITALAPSVMAALASLDGATVVDRAGRLLAAGAILRHPPTAELASGGIVEGARTTAAIAASHFGPVLMVSADGVITFFDSDRVWDI